LERKNNNLTSKCTTGIDRNRLKAEFQERYTSYFDLIYSKMREYVEAENVYNMDEKGVKRYTWDKSCSFVLYRSAEPI
jgi:hypothetical protein